MFVEHGRQITRDAQMARRIGSVRRDRHFQHMVDVELHHLTDRGSVRLVGLQDQDAGVIGAQSQLVFGTNHALGAFAANLGRVDHQGRAIGKGDRKRGANGGHEHFLPGGHIRSAADDLHGLTGADVDRTHRQAVGIGMLDAAEHFAYHDAVER